MKNKIIIISVLFILTFYHVGIAQTNEQLEVEGAIKIGNTINANEGAIRYTGSDFEGYTGDNWESLTSNTGEIPAVVFSNEVVVVVTTLDT